MATIQRTLAPGPRVWQSRRLIGALNQTITFVILGAVVLAARS